MYDKSVVLEALQRVEKTLSTLLKGVSEIPDLRELPHSPSGMLLFNGIFQREKKLKT